MRPRIPWANPDFTEKASRYVLDALQSTWVSHGPYVVRFEEEFTRHLGTRFGITTSNGTTALQLALLALELEPGDEVIVPGFTFVAPANMAIAVGAKPVFADVDPDTWCLDPASVERSITPKTRAIVAVHLYGNVCDMEALRSIATNHGLALVEDAAEACLSRFRGRCAGALSDIGCFSFQATKTISMGEGGFVATDDPGLHERMRLIRDHGMRKGKRYWHDVVGFNFRLTNLQAALGCAQVEDLDAIVARRERMYCTYREQLAGERGITMQLIMPDVAPVIWAVAVKCDQRVFDGDRDTLIGRLDACGIETRPGFYPLTAMPIYGASTSRVLPVSEDLGATVLVLPCFPALTSDEIEFVCTSLKSLRAP